MSSIKEAEAYLKQDELCAVKIECKLAEIQQWEDIALSITQAMSGDRVQSSGSKDKLGEAVTSCEVAKGEVAAAVVELSDKRKEISKTLDGVDNPTWYKLLHQKYIQHKQLKTIADNFKGSYDWAKTTHGRALKCVQKILDERGLSQ